MEAGKPGYGLTSLVDELGAAALEPRSSRGDCRSTAGSCELGTTPNGIADGKMRRRAGSIFNTDDAEPAGKGSTDRLVGRSLITLHCAAASFCSKTTACGW